MAQLNLLYTAPLPPGFVSGTVEVKSAAVYVDADGHVNQPYYKYALNSDGTLTSLQGAPSPTIIGMAQGDPATANPLDVVVNITASGLPTPLRSAFQVLPVDTGGGNLDLHKPDISLPVVGPLPLTIQQLQDHALDQQATVDDTLDLIRFQSALFGQMSLDVQSGLAEIPTLVSAQTGPALSTMNAATAQATSALATLSRTSGFGMLRANKIALDADFSLPAVGTLGTDNATGDVYLKQPGATDWGTPITNISAGIVDARRWVRPTNTAAQNSAALDVAATFSAQTGQAVIINEAIPISRTWTLNQEGYRILFGFNGWLKPTGDFPAVISTVIRGDLCSSVDISGLGTYTSVMTAVSGAQGIFNLFRAGIIRARGDVTQPLAVGYEMRSDGGSIAYVRTDMVQTSHVGVPVRLRANGTNGYVNSNTIGQITANTSLYGLDLVHEPGAIEVSANVVQDLQFQWGAGAINAIHGSGTKLQGNMATGYIFDWASSTPIIDMPRNQPFSRGNIFRFPMIDWRLVSIGNRDILESSGFAPQPSQRAVILPLSTPTRTYAGNQDDALVGAHKRWTVAYTGPAVTTGNVNNLFLVDPSLVVRWTGHTGDSVWLLTFPGLSYLNLIGLQFEDGYYPSRIKLEYQKADLTWVSIVDTTTNTEDTPVYEYPSNQSSWAMVALRLTVSTPADGSHISLSRMHARSFTYGGLAYLPTTGGDVYGDVKVHGNAYAGPNGDQLLAYYTKYPTALDVSGTPTDLATIPNGSIWYDSTAKLFGGRIASAARYFQPVLQNSAGNRPTANVGGLWFYNSTTNAAELYDAASGTWKQVALNFIQTVASGASATMTAGVRYLLVNRNAAMTITLLSGTALYTGQVVTIKDVGGFAATANITITPASGTIDGAANYVINTARGKVALLWDGTNWQVI